MTGYFYHRHQRLVSSLCYSSLIITPLLSDASPLSSFPSPDISSSRLNSTSKWSSLDFDDAATFLLRKRDGHSHGHGAPKTELDEEELIATHGGMPDPVSYYGYDWRGTPLDEGMEEVSPRPHEHEHGDEEEQDDGDHHQDEGEMDHEHGHGHRNERYGNLMIWHAGLGMLAFCVELPLFLALKTARHPIAVVPQAFFLLTLFVSIIISRAYKNRTPDLYPGEIHSKFGWYSIVLILALNGVDLIQWGFSALAFFKRDKSGQKESSLPLPGSVITGTSPKAILGWVSSLFKRQKLYSRLGQEEVELLHEADDVDDGFNTYPPHSGSSGSSDATQVNGEMEKQNTRSPFGNNSTPSTPPMRTNSPDDMSHVDLTFPSDVHGGKPVSTTADEDPNATDSLHKKRRGHRFQLSVDVGQGWFSTSNNTTNAIGSPRRQDSDSTLNDNDLPHPAQHLQGKKSVHFANHPNGPLSPFSPWSPVTPNAPRSGPGFFNHHPHSHSPLRTPPLVAGSVDGDGDHDKTTPSARSKVTTFFKFFRIFLERFLVIWGFVLFLSGSSVYTGMCRGWYANGCLAHEIKGGIFFWYGILTFGRYLGCFSEMGWAWNRRPPSKSPSWRDNAPTAEWVESFVIFLYGATNQFMERFGAQPGDPYTTKQIQHISIAVMFCWAGLLGMFLESKNMRRWLSNNAIMRLPDSSEGSITPPPSYAFSFNPFPSLCIGVTGAAMAAHHQDYLFQVQVHELWGNALAMFTVFRFLTYFFLYLRPPTSVLPSRPPTEALAAFCLCIGGLVFIESSEEISFWAMRNGRDDVMAFLNVTVAVVCLIFAWVVILLGTKGWAQLKSSPSMNKVSQPSPSMVYRRRPAVAV